MSKSACKTGILLAAFGSSSVLGEKALGHFAQRVRQVFPGFPVRWAYTSGRMRSRLAAAGKKTDSVKKALCRMGFERYSHVAVQSLHLIPGVEYQALMEETEAAGAGGGPGRISVGSPLLHDEKDVDLAAEALLAHLPAERRRDEPVVCVGHGTWHSGAASYAALSARLAGADPLIFIGTLSGEHSIDALLPAVSQSLRARQLTGDGPRKVWLLPLLSIIGKHAEQDMAGAGALSWRGRFEAAGFRCCPVLTGTVEYEAFAAIWLAHLGEALEKLRDS
ncbi:sirohydrochlorin cobaltochelatase [Desulfovibrio sp. OttesenSCG-928-G11]|nr:sirohydrochlorin cobaltochelatase [Desulfovibrio sp. OttesenSCG-928-G11]